MDFKNSLYLLSVISECSIPLWEALKIQNNAIFYQLMAYLKLMREKRSVCFLCKFYFLFSIFKHNFQYLNLSTLQFICKYYFIDEGRVPQAAVVVQMRRDASNLRRNGHCLVTTWLPRLHALKWRQSSKSTKRCPGNVQTSGFGGFERDSHLSVSTLNL